VGKEVVAVLATFHQTLEKKSFGFFEIKRMFRVTRNEKKMLAFSLAEIDHTLHSSDRKLNVAGKKWFCGFLRRHNNPSHLQQKASKYLLHRYGIFR
jgi:hypothetical protein